MKQQTTVPSFSLSQVGQDSSKGCYESKNTTILVNLNGPYFDRKKISLDPVFNCHITGANLSSQAIANSSRKLKEILKIVVVKEKYLRMNFDLHFQIVEAQSQSEVFCALVNLLSFALMLSGLEIQSVFSCACAWLDEDRIFWSDPERKGSKKMIMALQSAGKQMIHSEFDGQFGFLNFQKLTNTLMDANEEFQAYMIRKIGEINERSA